MKTHPLNFVGRIMDNEELSQEFILDLFYSHKGSLDELNAVLDKKLRGLQTRNISVFEKFIKTRLTRDPRKLKMADMNITPVEVIYLSQYPAVKDLEVLDLRKNLFGDVGLDSIAHSQLLKNLRELDLRSTGITRVGMQSLAQTTTLVQLEKLDLRGNKMGQRWEEKLKEIGKFPKLKDLKVI